MPQLKHGPDRQIFPATEYDLTGMAFGELTVLWLAGRTKHKQWLWCCQCKCGAIRYERSCKLPYRISCGCRRAKIHKPTYESFRAAKARCSNPNNASWKWYGARGIRFLINSFDELIAHIGPRPEGKTLDRIDNDGHYELGNVRWATPSEQNMNR